jgi:hypothetical protein
VLVRTWETETCPDIRAEARRVGATSDLSDESGIRSDDHARTTWARQGQKPVVQATGRRLSLNRISAVSAQGEFRFMLHEGSVGATGGGCHSRDPQLEATASRSIRSQPLQRFRASVSVMKGSFFFS